MTKLSMLIFQSPTTKASIEICLVIPKEGIVTLRGTGLAVSICKGPSLWTGIQHTLFCCEMSNVASYAHTRGGGG